MSKSILTCEECLYQLVDNKPFEIEFSDKKILFSISKQLRQKKLALTDRQYELLCFKLCSYKDQFESLNIDITTSVKSLQMPLREIDRSHYVRFEEYRDKEYIVIRFPFTKKIIDRIEDLRNIGRDKSYFKEKHKHYFPINEKYVGKIVDIASRFDNKFEIADDVIEYYTRLKAFDNDKQKYVPGIYNNKIEGLPDIAVKMLTDQLGQPDENNLHLYFDRKKLYGLHYFENTEFKSISHLSNLIMQRTTNSVTVNTKSFTLNELFFSILELKRFPLLVLINHSMPLADLVSIHQVTKNFVTDDEQVALCRTSNETNPEFNDYIRNNNLNNPLDKNTKVVYIMNNKLPKTIFKEDWQPSCCLSLNYQLSSGGKVMPYVNTLDLQIYYDEVAKTFYNYGQKRFVEKIG